MVHQNPTEHIQITEQHKAVLNFTQLTLKLMYIKVDDLFLTGRALPNNSPTQSSSHNNQLHEPAVTIVSMAQEGLVAEIDVTRDSGLEQSRLENVRG